MHVRCYVTQHPDSVVFPFLSDLFQQSLMSTLNVVFDLSGHLFCRQHQPPQAPRWENSNRIMT